MLDNKLLQTKYINYLKKLIELSEKEIERTKLQIEQSELRIAQLTKESDVLSKSGYRVSKQGRTGEEITDLVANEKEKLKVSKNALFQNSKITI